MGLNFMNRLFLFVLCLISLSGYCINPSFNTFDTNSFIVDQPGNNISTRYFTNASVIWVDPNGSDTTGRRGVRAKPFKTVLVAITNAQSGDLVSVMPGTNDISNGSLGLGIPIGVHVQGSGVGQTIFTFTGVNGVMLSNNSTLSEVSVLMTAAHDNSFRYPIQTALSGATNWLVKNTFAKGDTDVFYVAPASVVDMSGTILNCQFFSAWDTFNLSAVCTSNTVINIISCDFRAWVRDGLTNGIRLVCQQGDGTVNVIGCNFEATYAFSSSVFQPILTQGNPSLNQIINLVATRIKTSNMLSGATIWDAKSSRGYINIAGGTTTPEKVTHNASGNVDFVADIRTNVSYANAFIAYDANTNRHLTLDGSGLTNLTFANIASVTNAVNSLITNGINNNARIGPGTLNYVSKFVNTSNVGDSIIINSSTNLVEQKSFAVAYTNTITNLWYSEFTSASNWRGLQLSTSLNGNDSSWLQTTHGSGYSNGDDILGIQAWSFGAPSPHAGQATGTFYPNIDNTYDIGTSSARARIVYAGPGGFLAGANANMNFGAVSGYGFGIASDHINVFNSLSGVIAQFTINPSANAAGMDLDTSHYLMGGGSPSSPTAYMKIPDQGLIQFGTNNTATTTPQGYRLQGIQGTGANIPGGNLFIMGGASTGTNSSGHVGFITATNDTATGSAVNGYQYRTFISAHPVNLTESTATLIFNVALASTKSCGMRVMATTTAGDGTDLQSVSETFAVAAVNKAGTVTTTVSASAPSATLTSSGTLTTTWTAVANGNGIDVKCSAVSSLTQTNLQTRWRCEMDGEGTLLTTAQ